MADAVVSYTIEKLKEFVTEQVSIRTGVKDGIEWLKDELGYLLISVRVAEAHQDKDHIRLWTDSVRDVSNQAVIIMERFSAQQEEHAAAEQGGVLDRILAFCCRFICICNKEANLFDIGKEIEALKEKITGIKSRRDEYHINDIIMAAPIDDIWDVEVWKKIKYAFPDKKNGSRVIITTRSKIVADGVDDACFVHQLRFLSEEESWELFCKRAKPTPNLEIVGREMVDKCRGLPLAIVILSGLLLQKKTYTFWSDVQDHFLRKLKGKSSEIEELLNLSYDDLSFPLRQCFLYLARFPEDSYIEVFKLKVLWIAEEFISEADEEDGVVMEDVAEDYVNELANRNMIQIQLLSPEGQVLRCRVHDLVRALVIEKAREHKILGIFDSSKERANPIRLLQGQSRHAIYNGIGEYLKLLGPNSDVSMLRSLAITKKGIVTHEVEEVKLMYTRFKYLKVLDLRRVESSGRIPEEIGDLILLKFLGLMRGVSIVIPPSIGKLKKLQTLIGRGRYIFPKEISELKEIRHLCFSEIKGKLNIGNDQTKLQSIHDISHTEWFQIDTINWTNLRILVISGSGFEGEGYNLESIANLTNLRTLRLNMSSHFPSTIQPLSSCKNLKRVFLSGKIKDPEELSFLPYSVIQLSLSKTDFKQDPMPTLGRLSNLTALFLARNAFSGYKMVCTADAFPCLQFFRVRRLSNLKELQVDDGALPSLKAFEIKRCPLIEMDRIPQRVRSLPPGPDFFAPFLVY